MAGLITYLTITILGWSHNYRLDMAGVTGLIVAIGFTADSFIVYFERVRDELRDGRSLAAAVETGWNRAKRTILVADGVNFLAALTLYALASSSVRGFAFTLGLTTLIDLLVVFLFTHPVSRSSRGARSSATATPGPASTRAASGSRHRSGTPAAAASRHARHRTCVRRHRRRCGMSFSFATLGNDLYTGKRSVPVVPQRRRFYLASLVMIVIAVLGLVTQGLNLGLEFRGGSEFRVATTSTPGDYEQIARDAVGASEDERGVDVTLVGNNTVRVQTERLSDTDSQKVRADLAKAFGVAESEVSGTFIGPSWGASVSKQALRALVIFLLAVSLLMTVYFRNWKMAAAGLIALAHDLVITVGIYAWTGFEVSPATMIGFLTVLGYSLYDTVVVFDKVRENTNEAFANGRLTFAQAANLAVNQTMVRSINTTVIGLLPITAVLAVGARLPRPGRAPRPLARALRRHPDRRLLLDLHRHAAARQPAPA